MEPHRRLASWIRAHAARPVTHLKLQKLCFYCYGVARAHGGDLGGTIGFEAWQHGPVVPALYTEFRSFGAAALPAPAPHAVGTYDDATRRVLDHVLSVYDRLSAWDLRNQSHLERPWREAFESGRRTMDDDAIIRWFMDRYTEGRVVAPEVLVGSDSASLDGIPPSRYASLADLADALRQVA